MLPLPVGPFYSPLLLGRAHVRALLFLGVHHAALRRRLGRRRRRRRRRLHRFRAARKSANNTCTKTHVRPKPAVKVRTTMYYKGGFYTIVRVLY